MNDPKVLRREPIFQGKVVDLSVEQIELPNGKTTELEIIRHPGAAAMVPLTADNEVVMVRQFRYATGSWLLEVPAGKLDPGEAPEACAARELEEEIGFTAGEVQPLGWIWTTPGFTDEKIWLYLCRDLSPGRQELQSDEVLTVETVAFDEAVQKVHAGEICDGKSVCALLRAAQVLSGKE